MAKHTVKLVSGYQMPLFGLGTYKLKEYEIVFSAMEAALESGYRSFDTAAVYFNETEIGKSLKELLPKYNLKREDIFITTKLGPSDQGKDAALAACLASIEKLDCSYLDLYLVHWPGKDKLKPEDPLHRQFRKETWQDLEIAVKTGKVRSIGVSNYSQLQIEEIFPYCTVKPSVLQIEYHPHLIQKGLKAFCDEHNIHLQAYSSLGTSKEGNKLIIDPTVLKIAQEIGKSPSQILLSWALQQNIGVIPRSTSRKHICENLEALSVSLSADHMETLNSLDHQHRYSRDPSSVV